MKKIQTVLFVLLFGSLSISAQEAGMEEQMKVWMDYLTPGKVHEKMQKMTGEWKTTTKFWMAPDTEPMVSEGTAKCEMILGGRYSLTKHFGTSFGMPMEGWSIEGYDKASEEFTSIWIDNLGTGTAIFKGKLSDDGKTINYTGQMVDPMTKQYNEYTEKITFGDDKNVLMEMYLVVEGSPQVKMMEISMKR